MKSRVGFVSNSSSSSFIFRVKGSNVKGVCEACKRPFSDAERLLAVFDHMAAENDFEDTKAVTVMDKIMKDMEEDSEGSWTFRKLKEEGVTDFTDLYQADIAFHNEARRIYCEQNFEILFNWC